MTRAWAHRRTGSPALGSPALGSPAVGACAHRCSRRQSQALGDGRLRATKCQQAARGPALITFRGEAETASGFPPPSARAFRLARALPLALVCALLASGCDQPVRKVIEIPESDIARLAPLDLGVSDGDGTSGPDEVLALWSAQPDHGPFSGGTELQLSGNGFGAGIEVRIGDKQVATSELVLISPVSLRLKTPAGEVGPADIEVRRGTNRATLQGGFRYDPLQLDPSSGPTSGSTLVTLTARGIELSSESEVLLGGKPLTALKQISSGVLQGRTPANPQGPKTLELRTKGAATLRVEDAYSYYQSVNQLSGGLGGGAIAGTLTVAVLNRMTRAPVPHARVIVQRGRELQLSAETDAAGLCVFADDRLIGPLTVSAGAASFETTTLVSFDASELTLLLFPIVPPNPGGLPPGQQVPYVEGNILFGGATGAGLSDWSLVPKPRDGEVRRAYVFASSPTIGYGAPLPDPSGTIDFEAGQGVTGWPYSLYVRPGNLALYALAGIYTRSSDSFRPYAMGLVRGIVTAPGDQQRVDIIIDIPLTEKVELVLKSPPSSFQAHSATLALALGADGYIILPHHELSGPSVPTELSFARLPALSHPNLVDAFFALDVVLDSLTPSGLPLSRATELLIPGHQRRIELGGFLEAPRQLLPAAKGTLRGNTLRFAYPADAPSYDLAVTAIETADQTPVWRIFSPRGVEEVKLPDPQSLGLPAWPTGPLVWLQWLATLDSYDFNAFTYDHLRSARWLRWSFDQFEFRVEPQ